jgi:NitT/TauT family transport system ATP-binding protein
MSLEIKNLYKSFGQVTLFSNFSTELYENTITCILGPSGCGKTTLLNIIGGVITPDAGELTGFSEKKISYIFQDPRLLPWKTAAENIGFVLDDSMATEERNKYIDTFINLVELNGFADYYPHALSGGMRQRVSIARAFAFRSDIILMDEPFKGLDVKLKTNLIRTISSIWTRDKRTVVFVTHDVDEALLLGNDIVVLSQPPATILCKVRINIPASERNSANAKLEAFKQQLLSALGNR